jgi:hypothetical protein
VSSPRTSSTGCGSLTSPTWRPARAGLLEHEPAGLHPVIASRADPPLALARLRGRGQLAELRAAELRFTSQEAAELMREAVGTDLPETAAEMLVERTEGWVAGLPGGSIAAGPVRRRSVRGGFLRQPSVRPGLLVGRGARAATGPRCIRSCSRPRFWRGCPVSYATR